MSTYKQNVEAADQLINNNGSKWAAINPEYTARMKLQNRFQTGIEIAKYTADIMRRDMADYDADTARYTQSLGCWHGFTAQQLAMSVKKHRGTMDKSYIYLSGWMVAALRSKFGPLPDQSMHEKTSVPELIHEIYTFLKQADARELRHIFIELDEFSSNLQCHFLRWPSATDLKKDSARWVVCSMSAATSILLVSSTQAL